MFLKKKSACCNPNRQDCFRKTVREAMHHAEERGKKSGKTQTVVFDVSAQAWRISTKR